MVYTSTVYIYGAGSLMLGRAIHWPPTILIRVSPKIITLPKGACISIPLRPWTAPKLGWRLAIS